MRTRTTGLAGQQQARTPRARGLDRSVRSSGGVSAIRSSGALPAFLALRRGNLIHIWPASDSREPSSRDLALVPGGTFGPERLYRPSCDRRPERHQRIATTQRVRAGSRSRSRRRAAGVLELAPSKEPIKELAEFTLALVLFSDASRVGMHELRAVAGMYLRLLGLRCR